MYFVCDVKSISKPIVSCIFCNFSLGVNWHESHSTTSFHDVATTYIYLYILKERVGMNWHESHTRTVLIISLLLSEMTTVSMRITWIYQSAFLTSRLLICPWGILQGSKSHWLLTAFYPKGPLGRFPFNPLF